jgi:hypothetical protein
MSPAKLSLSMVASPQCRFRFTWRSTFYLCWERLGAGRTLLSRDPIAIGLPGGSGEAAGLYEGGPIWTLHGFAGFSSDWARRP